MKQHLFLMLGYPGSGKSYFAKQLSVTIKAVRLNGDGARYLMFNTEDERRDPVINPIVFGALDYATTEVLRAGYSVIYDASHNRKKDRIKASELAKPFNIEPVIIWVQVSVETAKQRHDSRKRLPDQVFIKEERFNQLIANLELPEENEKCIAIDGSLAFKKQLDYFTQQIKSLEA